MTVLGSVVGRVTTLESNLSQLVQFQLNMSALHSSQPPSVVIEPIEVEFEDAMDAKPETAGKSDTVGTHTALSVEMIDVVINYDSLNQVD